MQKSQHNILPKLYIHICILVYVTHTGVSCLSLRSLCIRLYLFNCMQAQGEGTDNGLCILRFTNTNETSSGEHKFRLAGILLHEPEVVAVHTQKYFFGDK